MARYVVWTADMISALEACRVRGLSCSEAAAELGVTEGSAYKATVRYGIKLRAVYETNAHARPKTCAICKCKFTQRYREGFKHFTARETCGNRECTTALGTRRQIERRLAHTEFKAIERAADAPAIELPPNAFANNVEPVEYGSLPSRALLRTMGGVTSDWGRGLG